MIVIEIRNRNNETLETVKAISMGIKSYIDLYGVEKHFAPNTSGWVISATNKKQRELYNLI